MLQKAPQAIFIIYTYLLYYFHINIVHIQSDINGIISQISEIC